MSGQPPPEEDVGRPIIRACKEPLLLPHWCQARLMGRLEEGALHVVVPGNLLAASPS